LAKAIEFTNVDRFEPEVQAHAQCSSCTNSRAPITIRSCPADIGTPEGALAAFRQAKAAGTYDAVKRWTGERFSREADQGLRDDEAQMEYFAETTEAYFDRNDIGAVQPRRAARPRTPASCPVSEKAWGTAALDVGCG
jgi:hypothetical protein